MKNKNNILNIKKYQKLKLKLNRNYMKNKKNIRKNKKIKRIKLEYFIID